MPQDLRSDSTTQAAPWSDVVMICTKCAAKLGRGHKGKTELRGEIKRALKDRGLGKRIRVAEVSCLDLCPKGGQTLATSRQMAQGRLTVVGPEFDGEAVVKLLFETPPPLVEVNGKGSDRKNRRIGQSFTSWADREEASWCDREFWRRRVLRG